MTRHREGLWLVQEARTLIESLNVRVGLIETEDGRTLADLQHLFGLRVCVKSLYDASVLAPDPKHYASKGRESEHAATLLAALENFLSLCGDSSIITQTS